MTTTRSRPRSPAKGPATGRHEHPVVRASRSRPPGWRNPRLVIGLALVAGSVLLGARLLAAAQRHGCSIWAVGRGPAQPVRALDSADLERRARSAFPTPTRRTASSQPRATVPKGATLNLPGVRVASCSPRSAFAAGARKPTWWSCRSAS